MATITQNLQTLKTIREDIKQAINNKGVTVTDGDSFTVYASKIDEIETSGAAPVLESISITENGIYTPPLGVDGFNEVNVDVAVGGVNNVVLPQNYIPLEVLENGYSDYREQDGFLWEYADYVVENPSNGEIGVNNFTYDDGELKYVQDVNGNDLLTPSNSIIDDFIKNQTDYVIEDYNGNKIQSKYNALLTYWDGLSEAYMYDINGNEYIVYYDGDTYTLNYSGWDSKPQNPINGDEYTYFHLKIKPAYLVTAYDGIPYGHYRGGCINNSIECVEYFRPTIFDYYFKCGSLYTSYYNRYCNVVAPYLKVEECGTYLKFCSSIYKRIDCQKIYNINGTFKDCPNLEEVNIDKVSGLFMNAFNNNSKLKKIGKIDCRGVTNINYSFTSTSLLEDIGGFVDLGYSVNSNQELILRNNYNLTKQSVLNIFNTIADVTSKPYTFKIILYSTVFNNLSEEDIAIATDKGWIITT